MAPARTGSAGIIWSTTIGPVAVNARPSRKTCAAAREPAPAPGGAWGSSLTIGTRLCATSLAISLAAALALASPAARAQQAVDPELKALIPDAAVSDPEAWANARMPGEPAPQTELRPDSPLAQLPELTLPWPDTGLDLPKFVSLEPEPDLAPALATAVEALPPAPKGAKGAREAEHRTARYVIAYPGEAGNFPERAAFEARFRSLSALQTLPGKEQDAIGQIAVRAASDRELLERLLRNYGYYEGEVLQTVAGILPGEQAAGGGPAVRFDVTPGARFRFGAIDLGALPATGEDYPALRQSFAIETGDPLHAEAIVSEQGHLDTALGEAGYPFATLGEPSLLVDHRREAGDLTLPVTPGGKYRFGAITSSLPRYLSSRHLAEIARFKPGQTWKRSEIDDLRKAILATGLVSSVTVTPRETTPPAAGAPGVAEVDVAIAKAPQRTIAGAIGYDTGEGFRLEASWEHRNLFPPEGLLRLRGVAGTNEQLAGITFRRNNFRGRDRVLTVDLYADNANLTAYAARKVAFATTYERLTTLLFQKPWTWSLGLEAEASEEREGAQNGVQGPRKRYVTAALPLRAAFDHSDDLLDPHRGWRASLRVSPELAMDNGSHVYAKLQLDASAYQPLGGVVLAGRVRLGAMPGSSIDNIAPSRRFYAGGGGSIRGFGYQLVSPRQPANDPQGIITGGRSLYEFSLEARVKTGLFGGAFSVVPFLDAGGADASALPHFADVRYGAGIGVRYQTGFGPIRVDIGTPLGRRPGESRIGVYVALGQAF
ncbi:MAG: BamA/TamA family outer membrane protein [Sphingomonadales bacterium]|nr:BamA/TamA family outer membrane protein [Sphingomonadales bacterium]